MESTHEKVPFSKITETGAMTIKMRYELDSDNAYMYPNLVNISSENLNKIVDWLFKLIKKPFKRLKFIGHMEFLNLLKLILKS